MEFMFLCVSIYIAMIYKCYIYIYILYKANMANKGCGHLRDCFYGHRKVTRGVGVTFFFSKKFTKT